MAVRGRADRVRQGVGRTPRLLSAVHLGPPAVPLSSSAGHVGSPGRARQRVGRTPRLPGRAPQRLNSHTANSRTGR